jgi:hypothetical protein
VLLITCFEVCSIAIMADWKQFEAEYGVECAHEARQQFASENLRQFSKYQIVDQDINRDEMHREWHVFCYEDPELRAAHPLGNFFASDKAWKSVRVRNCLVHTDVGKFELEVYDQVILPKRQGPVSQQGPGDFEHYAELFEDKPLDLSKVWCNGHMQHQQTHANNWLFAGT